MRLTKGMILYFIRDMHPEVLHEVPEREPFAGIRQLVAGEALQKEYIYVTTGREALANTSCFALGDCVCVLLPEENRQREALAGFDAMPGSNSEHFRVSGAAAETNVDPERTFGSEAASGVSFAAGRLEESLEQIAGLPCELILVRSRCSLPELMNRLNESFYRLIEWDKDMHIAVLEGAGVQKLLDISEGMLQFPTISFDGSFNVIAYTRHTTTDYPTYLDTIERGYTDSTTMEKLKNRQIFTKIRDGDILVAQAADDDTQMNIYMQFFHHQTLLGYTGIFYGETVPETGYLDLVRLFMQNMTFCMKRAYEEERHGRMMYETFLTNLLANAKVPEEQFREQLSMIDGIPEKGCFVLGVLDFASRDRVPLKFLVRMLENTLSGIKIFLHEQRICLLKISEKQDLPIQFLRHGEEARLASCLSNYQYGIGVSRPFSTVWYLRDAWLQADAALYFGRLSVQDSGGIFYYRDYWQFHFLKQMEVELNPNSLLDETYRLLSDYDARYHTQYCRIVLTYIQCGENGSRTAQILGIHRNTVRSSIQFAQNLCSVSFTDCRVRAAFLLSEDIREYQERKRHSTEW